jgi:hypothetical protein
MCDMGCRTWALRIKIWHKLLEKLMQKRKKKTGCAPTLSDTKNAGDYFSLDSDNNLQQWQ